MSDGLDYRELGVFMEQLLRVTDANPRRAKQFLQKQGTKMRQSTLGRGRRRVQKRSGKYFKSVKRGKMYTFEGEADYAIRVYSAARHAHLLEEGHQIKSHGKIVGRTKEQNIFADTAKGFQPRFEAAVEDFLDEMIGEIER